MEQHLDQKVDKATKLLNLLQELSGTEVDIKKEHMRMADTLADVYREEDGYTYRHQYSEISRFLYDNEISADACNAICEGLYELSQYVNDKGIKRAIEKLIDHITLESLRLGQNQKTNENAEQLKTLLDRAEYVMTQIECFVSQQKDVVDKQNELEKVLVQIRDETQKISQENQSLSMELEEKKEDIKKLEEDVKRHNIQSVSVLSIFAGIVFAFTGGLSILGNVFSNIAQITVNRASFFLACIVLVGLILFDVIHLFLYFVDRLSCGGTPKQYKPYWAVNCVCIVVVIFLLLMYYQIIPV